MQAIYKLRYRFSNIFLYHKKRVFFWGALLILGISSFLISLQAFHSPVYLSSTTVKVIGQKQISGLLTEAIVYDPASIMTSQLRFISGFPVIKKAAGHLGMIDKHTPLEEINQIVLDLQERISAKIIGSTNIIKITAMADTSHGAMTLANTVALIYIEESLSEKKRQSVAVRQSIEEQVEQIEGKLLVKEKRVMDTRLIEPLQKKLTDLEFELTFLLSKYTDKHPQIRQIQEGIKIIQQQLNKFPENDFMYTKHSHEIEVNRKIYTLLQEKLTEARITEAQNVSDISIVNPAILPPSPVSPPARIKMLVKQWLG